jgi:hypothetical protein
MPLNENIGRRLPATCVASENSAKYNEHVRKETWWMTPELERVSAGSAGAGAG